MKKNQLLIIALVILVGVAWMFISKEEKKEQVKEAPVARPVKTILLGELVVDKSRVFPGTVQASKRVDIAFRVSGNLIELPISRGQPVQSGQLLAKLDPRDFESQVKNAQAALDGANAQLASMRTARPEDIANFQAALSSAQARLTEATSQFQRIKNLFEKQAVAKSQYDQAKASLDVATANVNSARQELAKAKAGSRPEDIARQEAAIKGFEAQLKKAEDALKDTMLTAPFSGVVAELYVDNFQSVNAEQKIAVLQDLSQMEITINIPGNLILQLQDANTASRDLANEEKDARAIAVFPNLPNSQFNLKFKEIATKPDSQTQTYAMTFILEMRKDVIVLPGMVADVSISLPSGVSEEGFDVPPDSVVAGEGINQYVWKVVKEGEGLVVRKIPVTVGGYTKNGIIVKGDIRPGDRIVTAGVKYLLENDPVTLYEARP